MSPVEASIRNHRLRAIELLPWLIALGAYFGFGDYLTLGSQILIMILFALSLDLVLGYAGIVTLGHSAFFGAGAYAAGIYAARVSGEPLSGLLVAALTAALIGWVSGLVILRTQGLALLMLTLAVTALLAEAANKASFITGGADGLQGVDIDPIFGVFRFDLFGRTAYLYCLAVLFLAWLFARRLVHSSFGRSLVGIRENTARMHAIGSPVRRRLLTIYTISAALAGVAGALAGTDHAVRRPHRPWFPTLRRDPHHARVRRHRPAVRRVRGREPLHDRAGPVGEDGSGVLVFLDRPAAGVAGHVRARRHTRTDRPIAGPMTPALETVGLHKRFGALTVANDIHFRLQAGARHALIGPNGAGKTTFVNLITGRLLPSAGRILLGGEDITALPQAARVRRGLGRTFQINTLFRGLSVLENVCLAISERAGIGGDMLRPFGARRAALELGYALLERLRIADDASMLVKELPYGKQRLVEIAIALGLQPSVLLLDEPAAGVPAAESTIILDVIERLPGEIAVLIIEHDMELVFRFARRITVLVQGSVLIEGTPAEIAADARVREVYLGEGHHG